MFLAKLTDLHYKMLGLTVIYVPKEGFDLSLDVASKNKDLVKRLEGVVVYWTRQIRVVLQDQDQNTPQDLLQPIDEYEFWIYRCKFKSNSKHISERISCVDENLSGLDYQFDNVYLAKICQILSAVQSIYVRQFNTLVEEIHTSMTEAKSNIEYLQIIKAPCEEMKLLTPKEIPTMLMRILNLFRYIWLNSPYYNTDDKITLLCRGLSNQIILQCTEYLNMDLIFKSKRTRESIEMFQTCIDCCNRYIQIYILVSKLYK